MINRMDPFISIIIPTFERPHQLIQCMQALSCLDYPRDRMEVIVVNDGGREPLGPLLAPFHDELSIIELWQDNAGPAAARNTGAGKAKGDYLAFTDDDCAPDASWLGAAAAMLARMPKALIGGRTVNALTRNPYAAMSQTILDVVYHHFNRDAGAATFFASNNMVVPAAQFRAIGGFDPLFRTSEDRDLCDRWLHRRWPMVYVPEAIVQHAHLLTLSSFWRQHVGYGRGAWQFHRARVQRGGEQFRPDPGFYRGLLAASWRGSLSAKLIQSSTLLVAQVANAAGFFSEALHNRSGRASLVLPPIQIHD